MNKGILDCLLRKFKEKQNTMFPEADNFNTWEDLEKYLNKRLEILLFQIYKRRRAKKILKTPQLHYKRKGAIFKQYTRLKMRHLGMLMGEAIRDKMSEESFGRRLFNVERLDI